MIYKAFINALVKLRFSCNGRYLIRKKYKRLKIMFFFSMQATHMINTSMNLCHELKKKNHVKNNIVIQSSMFMQFFFFAIVMFINVVILAPLKVEGRFRFLKLTKLSSFFRIFQFIKFCQIFIISGYEFIKYRKINEFFYLLIYLNESKLEYLAFILFFSLSGRARQVIFIISVYLLL